MHQWLLLSCKERTELAPWILHTQLTCACNGRNPKWKVSRKGKGISVLFRNASFNLLAQLFPLDFEGWEQLSHLVIEYIYFMTCGKVYGSGLAAATQQLSETGVWRSRPLHRPPKKYPMQQPPKTSTIFKMDNKLSNWSDFCTKDKIDLTQSCLNSPRI